MSRIFTSLLMTLFVGSGTYFVSHQNHCAGGLLDGSAVETTAPSAPRYFAVIYSYQDAENHVMKSHTFAQFLKVTGDEAAQSQVEAKTISWLPARFAESLRLTVIAVKGKNFSFGDTLRFADRLGTSVKRWDPVEIDEATYQKALAQIDRLDSGAVKYKMYNSSPDSVIGQSTSGVSHCIHAVGDVMGRVNTGIARGFEAGEIIHGHFVAHAKASPVRDWAYEVAARSGRPIDHPTLLAGSE